MPDTAVSTRALVKRYRDVTAVDSLNLDVRRGEIYGFLGRNGAGKTTTIRMLLGLIRPSSGDVSVLGRRIRPGETSVFSRVGFLVETATAYPNLTVHENLDIQRRLTGSPPRSVADSIALLRLDPYASRRAGQLSLGNRQRLALAAAHSALSNSWGTAPQLDHRARERCSASVAGLCWSSSSRTMRIASTFAAKRAFCPDGARSVWDAGRNRPAAATAAAAGRSE